MSNRTARRARRIDPTVVAAVPLAADKATLTKLTQFHVDWQQAQARLQMAQQTLAGAQADAIAKEARFKGAVEFFGGPKVTFNYAPDTGVTLNLPDLNGTVPDSNGKVDNQPLKRVAM